MASFVIPPIYLEEKIERQIYKLVVDKIWQPIFKELQEASETFSNSQQRLIEAIKEGRVIYKNGYFTGSFDSVVSNEIRRLGGEWSIFQHGFKLDPLYLPSLVKTAIKDFEARTQAINKTFIKTLNDFVVDEALKDFNVSVEYGSVIGNVDNQLYKIAEIRPTLNDYQKELLGQKYSNNTKLYIKNWAQEEIIKLRKLTEKQVFAGYRSNTIAKMLIEQKGLTRHKATFLARQETSLLTTFYSATRYQENGAWGFEWRTSGDSRVRHEHKELNRKKFAFNDLPVIDNKGTRGLPGEAFGCRCRMIAVYK